MVEFGDYAENIADQYLSLIENSRAYITRMEYAYGSVIIYWEISHHCCGITDSGSINMPIQYLWEPDWKEKLIAEQKEAEAKKKVEAAEKAAIEKRERAVAKRKRELEQLAKLKLKYEE